MDSIYTSNEYFEFYNLAKSDKETLALTTAVNKSTKRVNSIPLQTNYVLLAS